MSDERERNQHFLLTPFFAVMGRVTSVVIPFAIAFYFGAQQETDAFFFTFSLVIALAGLFAPLFESVIIPYLAELKHSRDEVSSFTNGVLLCTMPVIVVIAGLVLICLKPFLYYCSGMNYESAALAPQYFAQMLPFLLFWILSSANSGIFHTHKIFWFPAVSPLFRSGSVLLAVVLMHDSLGMASLTGGFALGEFLRWGVGLLLLYKLNYWRLTIDWQIRKAETKRIFWASSLSNVCFAEA